jgi:hypothetical protein
MLTTTLGFNTATRDAFSRLRVSNPTTIFDSKLLFSKAPLHWDEEITSGAGITSTWSKPKASTTFLSTNTTACRFLRQTYQRFNYQPGKSNLVDMTFTLGAPATGLVEGVGQYDDANGIFFRLNGSTYEWVIRSSRTGSPVENAVAKANWNIDPMNGLGPSGITMNFANSQILIIDYQWLGVGRVRVGFDINGIIYYVHEFTHANNAVGVYMSTPNLPLRFEMSTTAATPASTMECICSSVISEGGTNDIGILRYESTNGNHLDANTADVWYGVIGVRLKTGWVGATVKFDGMSMLVETDDSFEWAIILNPTIAGSPTFVDMPESAVQTCIGETVNTITWDTGYAFTGGVVKASVQNGSIATSVNNAICLGQGIDGTLDQIWLAVRPLTINADVEASLTWREIL